MAPEALTQTPAVHAPPKKEEAKSVPGGFIRREYVLVFASALALSVWYRSEIDWIHYLAAFWLIDAIGYWPGLLAAKTTSVRCPPAIFYRLYNAAHNVGAVAAAASLYAIFADQPLSALGAVLHLGVDRGLLNNQPKARNDDFA